MGTLKRIVIALLTLAVTITLGVVGIVWALNTFTSNSSLTTTCTADVADLGVQTLAPDQADNAALITAIALQRGLPARAATIGIATAMQESKLRNINYGDRDSLGMFQQRPSQGWGTEEQVQDPRYATEAFYDVLARIEGYDDMPVTVAAQAVQRSAFPDAYAQHEDMARAFASALTGHAPATINCALREAKIIDVAGFAARLEADFPSATFTVEGEVITITATHSDNDDEVSDTSSVGSDQRTWAIANWAVAIAESFGVESVVADGMEWSRAKPWSSVPRTEDPQDTDDPETIVITFAGVN